MKVNKNTALQILEHEAFSNQELPVEWCNLVDRLSFECDEGANKTFIAMLGTALLARATNNLIDPFSLKAGLDIQGAYSARSLCKEVLAAHAPRLGIDLGVTGREPLNNQPFFAEDYVHEGLPVHARAQKGFGILLEALASIKSIKNDEEARSALRAFLSKRKVDRNVGIIPLNIKTGLFLSDLCELVNQYVSENSEYGKRAQACAAGILEVFAPGEVIVSKIHDPDRRFPGDIKIIKSERVTHTFEVRDKPVNEPDLYHFIKKVSDSSIPNAGVVAVGHRQESLDFSRLKNFIEERNIIFFFVDSWESLIRSSVFWSPVIFDDPFTKIIGEIHKSSIALEVSEQGIKFWENIAQNSSTDCDFGTLDFN